PPVDLAIPPAPYGKNTVHAIQAGIVYGYTGLVEYLVEKISQSLGEPLQVIGTGGLCRVISPLTTVFTSINPDLTLYGLKRVAEIVTSTSP
ncbi:MAG: type III pantothenate kinase, partial [Breznakiellaceae bacterium]